MIKISGSILTGNFCNIEQSIKLLEQAKIDWIHLDIMDGVFVPNISFGYTTVRDIRKITNRTLDVHLMMYDPMPYIKKFAESGADIITVHIEQQFNMHIDRIIQTIKDSDIRCGIALNPSTPSEAINYLYEKVDHILVMTVNPGFGGQIINRSCLRKVKEIRRQLDKFNSRVTLAVDGGVTIAGAEEIVRMGANVLVAGHAVLDAEDPAKTVDYLHSL